MGMYSGATEAPGAKPPISLVIQTFGDDRVGTCLVSFSGRGPSNLPMLRMQNGCMSTFCNLVRPLGH